MTNIVISVLTAVLFFLLYEPQTAQWIEENTELGNAKLCYYALLSGEACADDTRSGVYLIKPTW
jgi:hypothetical protein